MSDPAGPHAPLAREYDFIIVGGGSGGSVMARRLAERSDATVLLIEAGPSDVGVAAIDDAGRWTALLRGVYDWGYDYAPTPYVNGRRIGIPRGRVLGGSSSINAMTWNRGHPSDYDAWEAAGATGWNFATVLPYFKRAEDWEGGETSLARRRRTAPDRAAARPASDRRRHARSRRRPRRSGHRRHERTEQRGASFPNLNAVDGVRWSASRGYLRPVMGRANLTILTNSLVTKLGFESRRCVSVTHLVEGVPHATHAAQDVILCAGAIDTPRLLMMSGIGDAAELKRLDVPVLSDLKGVGQNLQDHPLLMGVNFAARQPLAPLRDNGGGCIVNWKSRAGLAAPDLHAFMVQGRHAGPDIARAYEFPPDCFAISPGLMRAKSRGYLRLESATPGSRVEIQPNFLREASDVQALAEAIDFCMDLAETAPLSSFAVRPVSPDRRLSRSEREAFVRQACDTFFHTCGTCAMGTDENAVVDPSLRVRGVDGLRIADASVIPIIPSCNTNAPVVMIAERAADFIVKSEARTKESIPAGAM